MTETDINELKDRLERAEMINEITCSALEKAVDEISRLNVTLSKMQNQYESKLDKQIKKMQKEIDQLKSKQTEFLSGKQPQRYF